MTSNRTLRMIIFTVVLFLCPRFSSADAAQLREIRVGEHKAFTRIVFEFEDAVRFKLQVRKDAGKVSVVFPDCTTSLALPLEKLRERSWRIDSVEFDQKESNLISTVTMYSAGFTVKPFYLLQPDRVVLDIVWANAQPVVVLPNTSQPERATGPITVKPQNPVKTVIVNPQATTGRLDRGSAFDRMQIVLLFVLVSLNIVTVVILALLSYVLLRRRTPTEKTSDKSIADSLRTTESTVISIDSRIREELKKYNRL
jgi:hypothetical protein